MFFIVQILCHQRYINGYQRDDREQVQTVSIKKSVSRHGSSVSQVQQEDHQVCGDNDQKQGEVGAWPVPEGEEGIRDDAYYGKDCDCQI